MEGPNERRSFDSKAADVQSVWGGGEMRGGGIREAVHRKKRPTSCSQLEREALRAEEMCSVVAFEGVRKRVGLGHQGALMQCHTTAESTRQMVKMSPVHPRVHPLTLFVLSGRDERDLRGDPDPHWAFFWSQFCRGTKAF